MVIDRHWGLEAVEGEFQLVVQTPMSVGRSARCLPGLELGLGIDRSRERVTGRRQTTDCAGDHALQLSMLRHEFKMDERLDDTLSNSAVEEDEDEVAAKSSAPSSPGIAVGRDWEESIRLQHQPQDNIINVTSR